MPSKRSARYWIFSNIFQNTSWHCKYFWPLRNTFGKDESPFLHAPISRSPSLLHTLTHTHRYQYTMPANLHRKTPLWVIHRLTIQIPTYAALLLFHCILRNGPFPNSSTSYLPSLGVTRTPCKWEEKVGRNVNWSNTCVNVHMRTCVSLCATVNTLTYFAEKCKDNISS